MKNNKITTLVFIIVLFGFMVLYPVSFVLINKGIVKPYISNYYDIVDGSGIIGKYNAKVTNIKNNINTKLTNYLIGYSTINQYYHSIKNTLSFGANNGFKVLGTNSDGEYIFKNNDFYVLLTDKNSTYIEDNIDKTISFYNELSKLTDLYIYLPNRYEFQNINDINSINSMSIYKDYFLSHIDSDIKVFSFEVDDIKEYNDYFYKTDHHWNAYGALKGYQNIVSMMNIEPKDLKVVKSDIKYRGAIAEAAFDLNTYDYFTYIDYPLNLDVIINDKNVDDFKPLVLTSNYKPYFDYYIDYYDGFYKEVIYYNNGNSNSENLLILGDSYSWSIDYIIASSFKKTYVINPKLCDSINLKEYIEKNNIDKVLILQETQTTIFDNYGHNFVEKLGVK